MSYEFYKVMHILGLMLVFSGIAGMLALSLNGSALTAVSRKFVFISHGVGLLLMLIGGFGMAARLNLMSAWPQWLTVKLVIWILLGGIVTLIKRKTNLAMPLYIAVLALGFIATIMVVYKPF